MPEKQNICHALDFTPLNEQTLKSKFGHKDEKTLEDHVCRVYVRTFAGDPWYEYMKCASCEETYSEKEVRILAGANDRKCKNINCESLKASQELRLVDYYGEDKANKILWNAVRNPGFQGFAATLYGKIVMGAAWGFELLKNEDTPTVCMTKVKPLIEQKGIVLSKPFYAAEVFVPPEFQGIGVGTEVAYKRFENARAEGYDQVFFRTVNTATMAMYARMFGKETTSKLFEDPVKKTPWYFVKMKHLMHPEERKKLKK